jgi:lipopolysaccharide export system protein LptA
MKRFMISLALYIVPLAAVEPLPNDTDSLSSTQANYDGNSLILTGHVILDHGLGKMTAEEASLQRQEAGKDFPFSLIQLRKDVLLALKNSAQITCGSADLDFTTLKGTLLPSEEGKVVYSDQIKKKKGGDATPLKLSGQMVELDFSKQSSEGKKTDYEIDTVLIKQEVVIEYADNFQLQAHHALYRKGPSCSDKTSQREFRGLVTAYPQDEQSQCRLSHDGDEVFADMIDIDLLGSKISLLHPKGVLATSFLPHVQKTEMRFQSDYLCWDHIKHSLTLKGHISIDEPTLGNLSAQDELQITQTTLKDKRLLQSILTKGYSTLNYKDEHSHCHKLISHGSIDMDRDKLRAIIESPTHDQIVPLDKQLYYEESEIAFYADSALLEYSIAENLMQPSLITLKGNIRLFSHDPLKPPRFGTADRLTYSLSTRTLILSANPGKKVLLWDDAQGMRLSAPEIHIIYDAETKQQNVKGIGAVQFAFSPEEQSKLRQLFPQLKTSP